MNRAWIPAGALAGVSVAGLIALGPLTDSLGTNVQFPDAVSVPQSTQTARISVPVSVNLKTVGTVKTAAFKTRGGKSAVLSTSSDAGQVALKIRPADRPAQAPATTVTPPAAKPAKKPAKRPVSIGGTSGANGDAGLAGGNQGSTGIGEQAVTPGG